MSDRSNILVVGAGYVGLATAVFLSHKRLQVTVVEKNASIVKSLSRGELHFAELVMAKHLQKAVKRGDLIASQPDPTLYQKADMIFIAIDSANRSTWKMNHSVFKQIAEWIGSTPRKKKATVILKSTNTIGFADNFAKFVDKTPYGHQVRVVVNPEFLREGFAFEDTRNPWRLVIGRRERGDATALRKLYNSIYPARIPVIETDLRSAELIKLASNTYLANRLAFIHEIADFTRSESLDLDAIQKGIGLDPRIGEEYFTPGLGFGGACLPKDCRLINSKETSTSFMFKSAQSAMAINDRLLKNLVESIQKHIRSLKKKKIAILGVAFKPEVDDTRGSRAVDLANMLRKAGADVSCYDPYLASHDHIPGTKLKLSQSIEEASLGADLVIIGCAHHDIKSIRPSVIAKKVQSKHICDYFNCLPKAKWEKAGFTFI